jgi:hypothetical protein
VERGSTQHSGRMDDALAEEVEPLVRSGHETRATEDREHEPPADDEPLPDVRIAGEDVPMPGLLDLDEIEARSTLATSLRPSVFPADREHLLEVANEQYAPPDVLEALETLPPRRRFVNVQQVWEALGGDRERRDTAAASVPTTAELPVEEPLAAERSVAEPLVTEASVTRTLPNPVGEHEVGDGEAWWVPPLRTGVALATLPLRIGIGVLRAVRSRLPR